MTVQANVDQRFGRLPNFFRLAPASPEIMANMWAFAQFSYLDNPLPSLFKERLFVYLSRFCDVRYCVARHVGFLLGLGQPSGDAQCPTDTIANVVELLRRPLPERQQLAMCLSLCEAGEIADAELCFANSAIEQAVFACATHVFLQTPDAPACLKALKIALGERRHEHLLVFLAFVRTAQFWTKVHPELTIEEDIRSLLATQESLAECILRDPAASRHQLTRELLAELQTLRQEKARFDAQQQAHHALRERAEHFRTVIDSQAEMVCRFRRDGTILFVNAAYARARGTTPDELTKQNFWNFVTEADRVGVSAMLDQLSPEAPEVVIENRFMTASGERWTLWTNRALTFDENGRVAEAQSSGIDITERKRAEMTSVLLSTVARELSASLDYEKTLSRVATVVVPRFADWCAVDLLDGTTLRRVAVAHVDAAKVALARELHNKYPLDDDCPYGAPKVVRTGAPDMMSEITDSVLVASARSPEHLQILRTLGLRSYICVPLIAQGKTLGVVTFVTAESRQIYVQQDLAVATELAHRAAQAIQNAQLYAKLELSEQRFQIAAKATNDAIWDWDLKTNLVWWNEGVCSLFGYTREQVGPGATWWYECIHPDDRNRVVTSIHAVIDGTQAFWREEYRYRRADGSYAEIFDRGYVLRDTGGSAFRMIGAMQDLSERKSAEEKIRQSEERYRKLAQLMPLGVFTCEAPSGMLTYYNEHAVQLWGRAPKLGDAEERYCGSYKMLLPNGTTLQREQSHMATAIRDGHEIRNETLEIERPDGSRIVVLVNITPVRDGQGRIVGAIQAFLDMTPLKRAEQALHEQALLTKSITDNAATAIFVTDDNGRCTFMNPAAERMHDVRLRQERAQRRAEVRLVAVLHQREGDGEVVRPDPAFAEGARTGGRDSRRALVGGAR
ncbi:MAG TPA: PAS domain S-box protein [Planctomycetota bacterium]|nr:PAS domain S-box protein [Planctomycetota bacterium]